jgi:hypothetical protein
MRQRRREVQEERPIVMPVDERQRLVSGPSPGTLL